jgi:hypothetical protein
MKFVIWTDRHGLPPGQITEGGPFLAVGDLSLSTLVVWLEQPFQVIGFDEIHTIHAS